MNNFRVGNIESLHIIKPLTFNSLVLGLSSIVVNFVENIKRIIDNVDYKDVEITPFWG